MTRYPLLVMLAMLALSVCVWRVVPVESGAGASIRVAGVAAVMAGIVLILTAGGLFRAKRTTVDPTRAPNALVTSGVYRVSRNPMYLGMLLLLAGCQLVMDSMAGLTVAVAFFFVMDRVVIPREEKVVEGVFGGAYAEYRKRTRRWI